MNTLSKTKYITSFVIFSLLFLIAKNTYAQSRIPIVVSPARQEIKINPKETKNIQIKFVNESSFPLVGKVKAVDFMVDGKNGSPILLDSVKYPISNIYSLSSWIDLPYENASIAANDILRLNLKISVPEDAAPGGRYAAVYFESEAPEINGQNDSQFSSTSSRIVSLIYVRVNGPVSEKAYIDLFDVPVFLQFGPVPISFDIFNKGDYHITPMGQITLSNWFNKEVETKNIESKNIFPDTKRGYEERIGRAWMFGKYRIDIVASYGEGGKVIETSKFVWVVPVLLIVSIFLTMIIVFLTIKIVSKKITGKQEELEEKLKEEISEIEQLKEKYKDKFNKKSS